MPRHDTVLPLSIRWSVCHTQRHRLSKSKNSFDQNFMKLGHIVKYHNVPSSLIMFYIALCLQEFLPFVYENSPFETIV